jgi:DNA-binding transcriptional regulator YhcF (GntR family)
VSQQELADLFGVARPSVARGFASMEKEGIIEMKNRRVKILDFKELRLSAMEG